MRVLKKFLFKSKRNRWPPSKEKINSFFFLYKQNRVGGKQATTLCAFGRHVFLESLLCRAPGTQLQEVRVLFSSKLSYN